jgi:hypothetical protein
MPRKKPVSPRTAIKQQVRQVDKKAKPKKVSVRIDLFEKINDFLNLHLERIFWISFWLTLLSGLLLFNIRISLSGDDSSYIIRAADFIQHGTLPGFQGPLYPILLSPFVGIFGIRVIILKFISLLLILGFLWLTYKAFKDRIPALLLVSMLFLVSVNSHILFYASQTYSEALFMLLQALTFLVFFIYFIDKEKVTPVAGMKHQFILAVCVAGLILTRSIGSAAVFAISGYFVCKGQWKNLLRFIGVFALVMIVFNIFKYILWNTTDLTSTIQVRSLLAKDYYNPALGNEDLAGIVSRFASNSNQYISNYFYTIIGLLRSGDTFAVYPFLTVVTCLMLLGSVILTFRKNSYLFFTGIYTLVFLFFTFIIVNTYWGQDRFIIPYISLIILVLLALFYYVLSVKQLSAIRGLLPAFVIILFILTAYSSVMPVIEARQIKNRYDGLTPDWKNYCKISEWASFNLQENDLVACRKPSISYIYGHGKRFYGIVQVISYPADSVLANWRNKKLNYRLVAASSLKNSPVSKELYYTFKNSVVGFGIQNELGRHDLMFYIVNFPDSTRTRTLAELDKSKVEVTSDYEALRSILDNPESKISIIYPDSLVQMLYRAKVTHVLTAHLSNYATVERLMSYIEFKYPEIKTKIMQAGSDDDDPAAIYKLNYDVCGIRK